MSGSVTGTDMRPDSEAAYEGSVSKVEETLAKFEQEHSIPAPPTPADKSEPTLEPDADSEPDSEQEPEQKSEQELEQEPADDDKSTPESKEGEGQESDKPAIPDNYFRAAQHQGWTPERISKLYDADPEGTVEFLKKVYEDTNSLNGQFAELGRKKIALEQVEVKAKAEPQDAKPELDLAKLRERYEDDPVGVMLDIVKAQTPKLQEQPAVQPAQTNQREEDVAVAQQLQTFFTGKDLDAYQDFYGSPDEKNPYDWSKTTPGQAANRQAVINEADAIIAGCELQGRQISVAEALEAAHLRVSAPIAEKVVREQLVKQVKKRSKGITLKPSSSQGVAAGSKVEEKSEAKAIETAGAKLTELKKKGL
jgi:hypothetical protein